MKSVFSGKDYKSQAMVTRSKPLSFQNVSKNTLQVLQVVLL